MKTREGLFRSSRSVVLLLAALVTVLAVGAGLMLRSDRDADTVDVQGEPMSDAQATARVVTSARQIVSTAGLQDATGGYAFVSCKNENEPPYQVAVYMNFRLPQSHSVKYLRDVAAAMAADGWTLAPVTGEHFGQKLTRDGVTAIVYRAVNDKHFATMRLYGECRDTADHRNDNPVWTEVTDQLG
jgi:hypothetical protein